MTVQTDPTDIRRDLVTLLPRLRRFALALTGQARDVDDLVRMACAQAVLKSPSLGEGDRLESCIFTLIRTIWSDEARKRRPRGEEPAHMGFAGHEAILSLPQGVAAAFLLVTVEQHTYAQSAAILDLPVDTVCTHIAEARRHFAGLMDDAQERSA